MSCCFELEIPFMMIIIRVLDLAIFEGFEPMAMAIRPIRPMAVAFGSSISTRWGFAFPIWVSQIQSKFDVSFFVRMQFGFFPSGTSAAVGFLRLRPLVFSSPVAESAKEASNSGYDKNNSKNYKNCPE